MKRLVNVFCLVLSISLFQHSSKATEKEVVINLMQRPLNYLDLGIINLEKDGKKN